MTKRTPQECIDIAQARCYEGSRECVGGIDMMIDLLKDVPNSGKMVKLGGNCPVSILLNGTRPDIYFTSIQDGDSAWPHEAEQAALFGLDVSRCDWRATDGLVEALAYAGPPIDLLFLDSDFTVEGVAARLSAWLKHLASPGWLVMHDWCIYPKVKEATARAIDRRPDRTSPWAAAWQLNDVRTFPLTPESLVWIVGGYSGVTAQFYAERYDGRVEVFEPQLPFAAMLQQMFEANPKVRVHPYGLRDHEGAAPMAQDGSFGCTFRYLPDTAGPLSPPYDFRDVNAELREPVDLLFLNCEGGEWEILSRLLDTGRIRLVKYVLAQFHEQAADRFSHLKERMAQTHSIIHDGGMVWTSWGRNE